MTRVEGSAAVVTGGASGIGRGIAEQLLARGARVAISDIQRDAAERTAAEIGAVPIIADVSKLDEVQAMADTVIAEFGGVDIVVNNAGVGPLARIADLTIADWRWMIDVNLFGVINGVHVFLPLLEANPAGGHIVNTSSMASLTPFEQLGSYAAAKSGVSAVTEVLQAELASSGSAVRASLLLPGSVRTSIDTSTRNRHDGTQGGLRDVKIDLNFASSSRWLDPTDVGRLVVDAIERDDPYIITHPERWAAVAERFARIEEAFARYAERERGSVDAPPD